MPPVIMITPPTITMTITAVMTTPIVIPMMMTAGESCHPRLTDLSQPSNHGRIVFRTAAPQARRVQTENLGTPGQPVPEVASKTSRKSEIAKRK